MLTLFGGFRRDMQKKWPCAYEKNITNVIHSEGLCPHVVVPE